MTQYYKFNVKVFEHLKDMEKSCVLMFLIQMANNKKEVLLQKTWLAKKLYISRAKTERLIKELQEAGLIETETTYIEVNGVTKTTTRFIFTAKLLELIGEENKQSKQPSKPSIIATNGNEEKQINTQNTNYTDYWENKMLREFEHEI